MLDLAVLRARGETTQAKAQAAAGVTLKQKAYSQLLLAFTAALFRVGPPTIEAQGKASGMGYVSLPRVGCKKSRDDRAAGERTREDECREPT